MNDESKVSYYAVIPATVRYDKELKANEKLLYGEITSLANKSGYCYALNRYFAELYNVTTHTVSQWISHLEKLNYIKTEIIRKNNNEVQERRIYINDIPYVRKNTYPYVYKNRNTPYKKIQENNLILIDDLFNLILNDRDKIQNDFYLILKRLELVYEQKMINVMQEENKQKIKEIIYTIYSIYKSDFKNLIARFERETLINLYISCKSHNTDNFLDYYKQSIINRYI